MAESDSGARSTVNESASTTYRVLYREGNTRNWALITVCDLLVQITSDLGSWSHRWHDIGDQTMPEFLPQCDLDYLMTKFGVAKIFNPEGSFDKMAGLLRSADAEQEKKEIAVTTLRSIINSSHGDLVLMAHLLSGDHESNLIYSMVDRAGLYDLIQRDWESSAFRFFSKVWPAFIEHLKTPK